MGGLILVVGVADLDKKRFNGRCSEFQDVNNRSSLEVRPALVSKACWMPFYTVLQAGYGLLQVQRPSNGVHIE